MNIKSIYHNKNLVWVWNKKETPLKCLTLGQLAHVKKKLQNCIKHKEYEVNNYSTRLWLKAVNEVMLDKALNSQMDAIFNSFGEKGKPFLMSTLRNPNNYPDEVVVKKDKRKALSSWSISGKSLQGKKDNYVKVPGDYIDRARVIKELKENKTKPVRVSDTLYAGSPKPQATQRKPMSEIDKIIRESKKLHFANLD
jgi:hypothetical protein